MPARPILIPLSQLSGEIAALTGANPPSYRRLYNLVLDGVLPVERNAGGRLFVRKADVPGIVETLGLTVAA